MRRLALFLSILLALLCAAPALAYTPANLQFGAGADWRPAPKTGALTGTYYTLDDWVQTGAITCNACRLYFGGKATFNNGLTGVAGVEYNNLTQVTQSANFRGDGGAHAGAGGSGGSPNESPAYSSLAGTLGQWPLYGSAGWSNDGSLAGGAGGAGIYIEAVGNILFTNAAVVNCDGGAGQSGGAGVGSGGGGGGAIDARSLGTITAISGSTFSAQGGHGGNGGTVAGRGGGGGLINFECLGGLTMSGTENANGGVSGTGPGATNGANGVINNNSQFTGPRRGGM